jgi:hypothetical protein
VWIFVLVGRSPQAAHYPEAINDLSARLRQAAENRTFADVALAPIRDLGPAFDAGPQVSVT